MWFQRDLHDLLQKMESGLEFQTLSQNERNLFRSLVLAAENNDVTSFVNTVGYAAVIQLIEGLSVLFATELQHSKNFYAGAYAIDKHLILGLIQLLCTCSYIDWFANMFVSG